MAPDTYNATMEWFGTGHKAGLYDLHGLSLMLNNLVLNTPERVWNYVLDYRLLIIGSDEFWITPKGKVWNVSFAAHELLIDYALDGFATVEQVELAGWLRVSRNNALHRTRLTRIQLETLARLRPDITPHLVFNREVRKVTLKTPFDCAPKQWSVWMPEVDAQPQ